ncbi:MAG: zinc-binding alcohol dehydrogenase [Clostridia bacterium]|nr:zinc-binding alcohol dehydrogenase [Clostridia bacterium]
MKNKNIIFTAPGIAEVVENDMPVIAENEVLVRVYRSTVSSGTERANLLGDPNISPSKSGKVSFPRQLGYSTSGVVVEVGSAVSDLKVGDRVACAWTVHAEYCRVRADRAYKLEDSVGFDQAALVHIATFPLAAIRKCGLEIGESALVMGLGVLGLIAVQLLRVAGAAPIIAVDPVESRRKQALELGADYALDPFEDGFAERVKEITGKGANVCIEITGNGGGLNLALDCMARFSRVALLGCTRNADFTVDYYRKVHGPGITLIGAHTMARPKLESSHGWWTDGDDARAILKLLYLGRLDFKVLIEEVHPYIEAGTVYTRLASENHFPTVQFDWSEIK